MPNDVLYPGGVTISDAMHVALQSGNYHPIGGRHSEVSAALAAEARTADSTEQAVVAAKAMQATDDALTPQDAAYE